MTGPYLELNELFSIRSDKLKELRSIIRDWKELRLETGGAAHFRLVVDTNVVLGDLRWLVAGRRSLDATTSLMETIDAETIEIYVPPRLFVEVEEKIPLIAEQQGLDPNALLEAWHIYREKIKVAEPAWELIASPKHRIDPDDAEFVALADTLGANGVISKDKHISKMGGNAISMDCVVYLRNYSRSTAIELNIKIHGVRFALAGAAGFHASVRGIRALIAGAKGAPNWLKLGLVFACLFALLHPRSRAKLNHALSSTFSFIGEATPHVVDFLISAATLAEKNKTEAQIHLANAMKELTRR